VENLIANSNESIAVGGTPIPYALPTRIITYAWGEHYLDILLSLTIPALLAPGNLPYVVASTSCELVILTEERFFPAVAAHPSVMRATQLCLVRLIALDDLISRKDSYGMALTHALHRGFSDLGPAMTDSWQLFLNADFVLAEGSLRSVISRLAQGERLVASPSYCVDAFAVIPELRERVRTGMGILAIPPRELAAIALAHRHNTIRGKTINQREITLRYLDQFYWLVDDHTLVGHQMPIAIVGMRPQRHLVEPNSYWDHGLMREYCPDAQLCVIGDSDEFLMIELREKDVAQQLIESGRPAPEAIAERMVTFLTDYQRNCACHELTLHSREIPSDATPARQQLRSYVDEVLSHVPAFLPSHINHPQWDYHRPRFVEFRHKFLSERLGPLTEALSPPAILSKLDRAWWKYDGAEKRAPRRESELREFVDRELGLLGEAKNRLEHAGHDSSSEARAEFRSKLDAARNRIALQRSAMTGQLDRCMNRDRLRLTGVGSVYLDSPSPEYGNQQRSQIHSTELQHWSDDINALTRDLCELYQLGSQLNNLELEQSRTEYHLTLPRRVASAEVPYVAISEVLGTEVKPSLLGRAYRAVVGYLVRRLLQPLDGIIAAAAEKGDVRVLHVGSASGVPASTINHVRGLHVRISTAGMMTGNFAKAFETPPIFDICVCDLRFGELEEFPQLVAAVQPFMAEKGVIAGFHLNQSFLALRPDHVLPADFFTQDIVRIHQVGSWTSAVMLRLMHYVAYSYARLTLSYATRRTLLRFLWRFFLRVTILMFLALTALVVRGVHLVLHPKRMLKFSGKSILLEVKPASTGVLRSRTAFDIGQA
jgi:hypothetical protein